MDYRVVAGFKRSGKSSRIEVIRRDEHVCIRMTLSTGTRTELVLSRVRTAHLIFSVHPRNRLAVDTSAITLQSIVSALSSMDYIEIDSEITICELSIPNVRLTLRRVHLVSDYLQLRRLTVLRLRSVDLRHTDFNGALRCLGQLRKLDMRSVYLPLDYTLDLSKCSLLKRVIIRNSTLYNIPLIEDLRRVRLLSLKKCTMNSTALYDTDLRHITRIVIKKCRLYDYIADWCRYCEDLLISDSYDLMTYRARIFKYRVKSQTVVHHGEY